MPVEALAPPADLRQEVATAAGVAMAIPLPCRRALQIEEPVRLFGLRHFVGGLDTFRAPPGVLFPCGIG